MEILHSRKMNFKGRSAGRRSLRVPPTFFLCFFFFICGLFASKLLSRQEVSTGLHPKLKVQEENREFHPLSHGETGEDSLTHIPFQVLSWKPRALYFPGFATPEQCESIIKIAKASLEPSTLALRKGEKAENLKGIRTSSGTFIKASEDKSGTLDIIEDKISSATMIPRTHGEVASFLLYLSDVEEGGETMFPYENGLNYDNYDPDACAGLKVKPRKGDGLLFYSLYPNGTIDKASLHGSCPVIRGQKWVATKWLRNQLWVPKGG
ncbi:probable prolyl 4-hydroxylase 9 isoform X2 [Daucus carota subsp. sativus]|uniref:probable prolyl 4-hydroxylase 9 isoform X2 n=1 Tax=Daucus carota subsp. sativus TaxID=79200 RepID=UPI0007EF6EBC|nr:PREDICTED: probable prolyl 4-hydroxylase 9 isoform X2 [Daucus carota subsp. sativus]XP_017238457.1 PREDICTED: probable prolyl 4-hydroxylase 9 isoform X2 [Daucus carota subsp. sativus]